MRAVKFNSNKILKFLSLHYRHKMVLVVLPFTISSLVALFFVVVCLATIKGKVGGQTSSNVTSQSAEEAGDEVGKILYSTLDTL